MAKRRMMHGCIGCGGPCTTACTDNNGNAYLGCDRGCRIKSLKDIDVHTHAPLVVPHDATCIEVRFSPDVFVRWPSWDDSDSWDVWDSTRVRQGAHRIETVARFTDAIASAQALVREHRKDPTP